MEKIKSMRESIQYKITGQKYHNNLLGESLQDQLRKATAKTLDAPDATCNQQVTRWEITMRRGRTGTCSSHLGDPSSSSRGMKFEGCLWEAAGSADFFFSLAPHPRRSWRLSTRRALVGARTPK